MIGDLARKLKAEVALYRSETTQLSMRKRIKQGPTTQAEKKKAAPSAPSVAGKKANKKHIPAKTKPTRTPEAAPPSRVKTRLVDRNMPIEIFSGVTALAQNEALCTFILELDASLQKHTSSSLVRTLQAVRAKATTLPKLLGRG